MLRTHPIVVTAAALLVAAFPHAAQSQAQSHTATIIGWIRDSTGVAVGQADIEVLVVGATARTDSLGRFALRGLQPGAVTVRVRRFGYDPQTFDYVLRAGSEDSIAVTMLPRAQALDPVRTAAAANRQVKELDGFNRRRAAGAGTFITRRDIERHNTELLSETLREVPGIRFVRAGAGRQGLRFDSANSRSYDCQPLYWIDGRKVLGAELDDFPASDVEGIELYKGPATTPVQFAPARTNATCGTVVIWTRVPELTQL
jgi:hypothetical protein